jgi:uncharacterized protein YfaT (DUF1175 family)
MTETTASERRVLIAHDEKGRPGDSVPLSRQTIGKLTRDADRLAALEQRMSWQQPAWQPIDSYPKDQGIYRNGTQVWLWHEDLGVCWGFMDDLPSGFRCEAMQLHQGRWVVRDQGVKAAKKLRYWMPRAPSMPEPPALHDEQEGE